MLFSSSKDLVLLSCCCVSNGNGPIVQRSLVETLSTAMRIDSLQCLCWKGRNFGGFQRIGG